MTLSLDDMTAVGAHQRGHFQLSSGLHSGDYLQCALYLAEPTRAERAGRLIAERVRELAVVPDTVVSPALGGVIIGHEVARALGLPFVFTERKEGQMMMRRGFALAPSSKALVVEDVVTTGGSTREVLAVVQEAGATPEAIASMVNRSGLDNPFDPVPYAALLSADFPTWTPDECPLCRAGTPITKPGSRPVG